MRDPIPLRDLNIAPRWLLNQSKPVQFFSVLAMYGAMAWELVRERSVDEPKMAILFTLLFFAATFVLSELLRPKPNIENERPLGLGDFPFPTATEDRRVALVFGTVMLEGPNVVWYGDFTKDPIEKTQKTGMFSKSTSIVGWRYRVGIQFALCRGPNVELIRVLVGDKEVFSGSLTADASRFDVNDPELFGGNEFGTGGMGATCDFYTGSDSQAVNAYLDDDDRQRIATAITPAAPRYVGTSYVVARQLTGLPATAADRGAYLGNSANVQPWKFEVRRFSPLFPGQTGVENKIGTADCNPINVAYELLTDTEWGFGFDPATIDATLFKAAADTLRTEGNGFSMAITSGMQATDFLGEIQRQIDGVIFVNQGTGKWEVKLARADFDIDLVPQLTDDNVKAITGFTRGSWEDTTNQIILGFTKRDDDYKASTAFAQDMANAMIQGNGTPGTANIIGGESKYPGVMDSDNAAKLVWRDLRGQTYPLARGVFTVTREFWNVTQGSVVALTNTELGYVKLPMRVVKINFGNLDSNEIKLTLVQDIFQFAAAGFGAPQPTGWNPPVIVLGAYPSDEQVAIESPRAVLVREPGFSGDDQIGKVWCGTRRQGGEIAYQINQRNAPTLGAESFNFDSTIFTFFKIGQLKTALGPGVANPTAALTIEAVPDSQTDIVASFFSPTVPQDLGVDLTNLLMVGDGAAAEFMLVRSAANGAGSDIDLANIYRGVLDSSQQDHAAAVPVYLIFVAGGLTEAIIPNTNEVEIELRQESSAEVYAGAVTAIALTMNKRAIRPYSPSAVFYNSISQTIANNYNTPDLEDNGSGENGQQFATDWWRRNYDTLDEVAVLNADIDPDLSPLASGTEYRVRVFVDPSGANTEIPSSPTAWAAGTGTIQVPRLEILDIDDADTEIRVEIEVRHDIGSEADLTGRSSLLHDVVPTSVNNGLWHLGSNIGTGPSTEFVVADAGVHTVDIGAAAGAGNARYRINGGSWLNITFGGTATASLSVSDTIEVQQDTATTPNFVLIDNPSAVRVAYGVL